MSNVQEALKAALAAIDLYDYTGTHAESELYAKAESLCKAALAEIEKCEPVAEYKTYTGDGRICAPYNRFEFIHTYIPNLGDLLFASPQPREWVGLPNAFLQCFTTVEQKIIKRTELELKLLNSNV